MEAARTVSSGPGGAPVAHDEQFRLLFEHSPIGIALLDLDGRWVDVNDAVHRITGWTRDELLARDLRSITHADDLAADEAQAARLVAGEIDDYRLVKRYVRPDGTDAWVLLSMALVRNGDGATRYALAQIVDIDAEVRGVQERAAAAEREREERATLEGIIALQQQTAAAPPDRDTMLQLVLDSTLALLGRAEGAAVAVRDDDGGFVHVAAGGTLERFGSLRLDRDASLAGLAFTTRSLVWSDDTETDPRAQHAVSREVGVRSLIVAPVLADDAALGTLIVVNARPAAFHDSDRPMAMLLANCLSTALRQAEDTAHIQRLLVSARRTNAALRASEERFRLAFARNPLGMIVSGIDPDGPRRRRVNAAMARITGWSVDELETCADSAYVHPDDRPGFEQRIAALRHGATPDHEAVTVRMLHRDGRLLHLRLHVGAVRDDDQRVTGLVMIVEDMTAELAARRELAERARLLELARDAIVVTDLDGHIRYWNPGAERMYRWPADAVLGRHIDKLLVTRWNEGWDADSVRAHLMANDSWEGELTHLQADGRRVVVLTRKALQRDDAGRCTGILSINSDITARRAAESRLRASEALFRSQFEHSGVGQAIRDLGDRVESANPALAALVGVASAADLVGRPVSSFAPDDPASLGRTERADLVTGALDTLTGETTLGRADGGEVDVQYTISVLRNDAGEPQRLIAGYQDISDRRAAERARDEAAAALQQRNDDLERINRLTTDLIGVVGHDINNPLTVMLATAEMAATDWADAPAEYRDFVELVRRNGQRLEGTVREALSMVTIEAGRLIARPEPVRLAERLGELACSAVPPAALVCADDVVARVQPEHLDQMVANLLTNAGRHGATPVEIRVRRLDDRVEIAVVDHGPGVPEDALERLFTRLERDERTGTRTKGTGLGLYIVRQLARANGGEAEHRPTPGGGATFVVSLPV
ncbi:MAG: PAS domain S-box protein [Jatrophihabitans sp.]|uniref:PAS domain S-box protein n=1 Tax=Jatrophihabitans sp. TaxID=1932789 RepID=UPI003F7E18D0